jgi:hypothetical protein
MYPPVLPSVASKRKLSSGFELPESSTAPEVEVEIWVTLMAWTIRNIYGDTAAINKS